MIIVPQKERWNGKRKIEILASEFVETAVLVNAGTSLATFSFAERPYLRRLYDTECRKILLKCGRQIEKSTTLGNKALAYSCLVPRFRTLYVSPTNAQTREFSNDRLREPIETCPMIAAYTNSKLSQNVLSKQFQNWSKITLRYAFQNPDRVRGIRADMILIDEFQDILLSHVPVIEECASHSDWKILSYSGTPKSLDNSLEQSWQRDTNQCEWVLPCFRHQLLGGTKLLPYWNVLGEASIGLKGPICDKCGAPIYPDHPDAHWVAMNPNPNVPNPTEGYHISQLMVPWVYKSEEGWGDIIHKSKTFSRQVFFNEVLGLAYDSGIRPLTREEIRVCCGNDNDEEEVKMLDMSESALNVWAERCRSAGAAYAGIDWGGGEKSYTVITIGTYWRDKFTVFYAQRFMGMESELEYEMRRISELISRFNVKLVGCDYGGGLERNDTLIRKFGPRLIVKYQYVGTVGKICEWDPAQHRFKGNRSSMLSAVFNTIKRQQIRFPLWKVFQDPFATDLLSVYSEYNERQRMTSYDHALGSTDDTLHSLTLLFFASMIQHPRPDVLAPGATTNTR